jgi:hypothetical protein
VSSHNSILKISTIPCIFFTFIFTVMKSAHASLFLVHELTYTHRMKWPALGKTKCEIFVNEEK